MAWTKSKTFATFRCVFFLSIVSMAGNIALLVLNLKEGKGSYYDNSFAYLLATVYGTGVGCLCFRFARGKVSWTHAIIHILVLCVMIGGHRKIFTLIGDNKSSQSFHQYALSIFTIGVYFVQFLLSFHFVVFRYGRTPSERAFRSGLHAFLGALTFFICVMDGLLVTQKMALDSGRINELFTYLSCLCLLFYAMCVWYLILNPYFDWRRLGAMAKEQNKPVIRQRSVSMSSTGKSPVRQSAVRGRASASRGVVGKR